MTMSRVACSNLCAYHVLLRRRVRIPQTSVTVRRARSRRITFGKTIPLGSRILFLSAVFALFAAIGFISLVFYSQYRTPLGVFTTVFIMGGFAVAYAGVSFARRHWIIPVLVLAEAISFAVANGYFLRNAPRLVTSGSPLRSELTTIGIGSIAFVALGYALFITFFVQQGSLLFRAQTEITLAGEIHRALVPTIERDLGIFQIYGVSVPSGEVGGDLVDLVGTPDAWTAYIADVSGHGVSAGLLMAMFKTAVRTSADASSPDALLQEVHRALYPLKTSNTFVTAAVIQFRPGSPLSLSLAGHPALLRYNSRSCQVEEYPSSDMPVGILPEQSFSSVSVSCEPQDVLLLITDGLSEVFDKAGNELGLGPIKSAFAKAASLPLPDLFSHVRQVALDAGRQEDDQTMLLVRRVA